MLQEVSRENRGLFQDLLDFLQENLLFLIKEADKVGNIVLCSTEAYLEETRRQFSNRDFYVDLPSDPTTFFKKKYDELIGKGRDMAILTKKEFEFLKVHNLVVPMFYLLPKVHKKLERPPGCPIVAGIGGLGEKACIYVDFYLQPIVLNLPSHIRDLMRIES